MNKLRIKKGDTVKVLSGKDKGKTGKVLQVLPKIRKAVVENMGLHTRFEKSKKAGQPGKKIVFSSPLPVAKLHLIDPHSGKPTRVAYRKLDSGVKQRMAKVSGKAI
ncbi:MAG: 50S ribosomal protein L24 [Candidatus Doudnabacteria bacterium]|nr:50S ribosomal protein L24 [Candidatus Doudnabacteria bacterium]